MDQISAPSKKPTIQLIAIDADQKLWNFRGCKITINKIAQFLLMEPQTENIKVLVASFDKSFYRFKNILCILDTEENIYNFMLILRSTESCENVFDEIQKSKEIKDTNFSDDKLFHQLIFPILKEIQSNQILETEIKLTLRKLFKSFNNEGKQKCLEYLKGIQMNENSIVEIFGKSVTQAPELKGESSPKRKQKQNTSVNDGIIVKSPNLKVLTFTGASKAMIVIQNFDDTVSIFSIDTSDSVMKLKELITEKKKINVSQYYLVFNDTKLENEKALSDYGIQNESFIKMVSSLSQNYQSSVLNNAGKSVGINVNKENNVPPPRITRAAAKAAATAAAAAPTTTTTSSLVAAAAPTTTTTTESVTITIEPRLTRAATKALQVAAATPTTTKAPTTTTTSSSQTRRARGSKKQFLYSVGLSQQKETNLLIHFDKHHTYCFSKKNGNQAYCVGCRRTFKYNATSFERDPKKGHREPINETTRCQWTETEILQQQFERTFLLSIMGKGVANIKFYVEKYKEKYEKQFGHVSFNKNYAHDNIKRALESKAVKSDSLSAVDRKFQFDILETDDEEEDDDEDDEDGDNEEDDNELSNCC